tara:strand:- start:7520 stop:7930 length:411 start_codon:yes stop_codon:yes gene_type:complete
MKDVPTYMMKYPTSIAGRIFYWYFKRVFNYGYWKIRRRGRHPNRQRIFRILKFLVGYRPNMDEDVPIKWAKEICIYAEDKAPPRPNYYWEHHQAKAEVVKLRELLSEVLDAVYENGQSREEMVGDVRRIISESKEV